MRSASTVRAATPAQLHENPREPVKEMSETAIQAPRVKARAAEPQAPPPQSAGAPEIPRHIHRIVATARPASAPARALEMGQIMQLPNQPTAQPPVAPVPPTPSAPMTLAEATSMLPGLQAAVTGAEDAKNSGGCKDLSAADLATARTFKDRMAQFVAGAVPGATFTVEKPWLDAADNVVKCAIAAEKAAPNTGAYVALGVIAVGTIVALSV